MDCQVIRKNNKLLKIDVELVLNIPIKAKMVRENIVSYETITTIYVLKPNYFYSDLGIFLKTKDKPLEFLESEIVDTELREYLRKNIENVIKGEI